MLTSAAPLALQRDDLSFPTGGIQHTARPPAFDLLVIDEAPFLNLLGGFDNADPVLLPVASLDPKLYQTGGGSNAAEHDAVIEKALLALAPVVEALFAGGNALKSTMLVRLGSTPMTSLPNSPVRQTCFSTYLGRPKINPARTGDDLAGHLRDRVERMSQVRSVQRLLRIHHDISMASAAVSCLERDTRLIDRPRLGSGGGRTSTTRGWTAPYSTSMEARIRLAE